MINRPNWLKNNPSVTFITIAIFLASIAFSYSAHAQGSLSAKGIAYDLRGVGVPVVFIHGSNLDRRMWSAQLDYFENLAQVLAYDLRGLGSSEIPTQTYSDAGDLLDLLDELQMSNVILVGLSAGAQVALDFASTNPERVRKLVLVSPSLNGFVPTVTPPYLSDLISALRAQDHDRANEVLLNSELLLVPSGYTDLVRDMVISSRQWNLSYELMEQSTEPLLSRLDTIEAPTLILVGDSDLAAITELGKLLDNELPNASVITVTGGRHLLNLGNPAEFNTAIAGFLELSPR